MSKLICIFLMHNIHTNQKTTQNVFFINQIIRCMLMDKKYANFEILLRNYIWALLVFIQMQVQLQKWFLNSLL